MSCAGPSKWQTRPLQALPRLPTTHGGRSSWASSLPTLLHSLPSLLSTERRILDTLWFATGGGKTETYLLFTVTAAFFDRLRGKSHGITSWGRFPLRMLSLQQTQTIR